MNQDILNLYNKAQNGGLNAQEVFWLEGQAAAHPCFGIAYLILARHHYRNQSTIKNRALLKAAAFANNRSLLRSYLEDTLTPPRHRPVPVAEMKPILDKKAAEQETKAVNLEKKADPAPVETPAAVVETPAVEVPVAEVPVVETPAVETPVIETPVAEVPVVETPAVETPVAEVPVAEAPVVEAPAVETPAVEAPVAEVPVAETPAVEAPVAEKPVAYVGVAGEVNWFLNMRVKLRTDKHKATGQRLQASIAKFAPAIAATTGVAEAAQSTSSTVAEVQAKPVEAVQKSTPPPPAEVQSPPTDKGVVNETPAGDAPATPPDKQYEIGAFSSFTFIEGESNDAEDEMDTGIATLEAVEFKASDEENGMSEIIFEENDRIIEISVSPEALHKYFKGRLPVEHASTFGEFKIELDELEYHAAEGSPHTEQVAALAQRPDSQETERETLTFDMAAREDATPPSLEKASIDAIIDRFIENEPGITRAKVDGISPGDLAKDSNQFQDDEFVTETLAKIYEKQGNKSKAIKIYEKLRLRIPEKNDYFVSLIEKLKH